MIRTHRLSLSLAAAALAGSLVAVGVAQLSSPSQPNSDPVVERLRSAHARLENKSDPDVIKAREEIQTAIRMLQERAEQPRLGTRGYSGGSLFSSPGFGGGFGPSADPFSRMEEMQRMADRMMRDMMGSSMFADPAGPGLGLGRSGFMSAEPSMDISDEGDRYVVRLDIPGMDPEAIEVEAVGQSLIVSGQREQSLREQDEEGNYLRQERHVGSFHRMIPLPGPVKAGEIEANYENGVLKIVLPKRDDDVERKRIIVK